ncbi:Hypothetical_protein [Hexamita inflata]|uniref:Hypothetical_protein n=1 Tax=Hexamita inflata TaxID=28002 RepID=A0ABP1H937_9EUKA
MLFNQPIQTKQTLKLTKELNYIIQWIASMLLLCLLYLDSLIQLKAEALQQNSLQLFVARLLVKPLFSIIIWVVIVIQENQYANKRDVTSINKSNKRGQIVIPGYTQPHFSILSSQPLCGLIMLSVGQTVIGPYHPRIFIMLAIGVLVFQHFLGEICMNLFNWFMQDIYGSVSNYFDNKKRQRISRLIKESIYSGTE